MIMGFQVGFRSFSNDGRKEDDDTFYILFIFGFNHHSVGVEIIPASK